MRTATFLDSRQRERCTECGSGLDLCTCEDPDAMALERLTSPAGRFLADVLREEDQLGVNENHLFEKIVEEIGAVGAGLVNHADDRSVAPDVIRKSLVKLAALTTRLATAGTEEYPYPET